MVSRQLGLQLSRSFSPIAATLFCNLTSAARPVTVRSLSTGNKQWGDKMQDDVTWGAKYLIAQGIADPKRIGIMGWFVRRIRHARRSCLHT